MKNFCKTLSLALGVITITCLLAFNAHALSTDRDQPADIEADDIEFDFKKGTRTYTNNVLVVQGTLRLKADKLLGVYTDGELSDATAWGSLARFKQRPDGKDHDVEGWAKKIIVDLKSNTLTLIGKAALQQGPDTARGDTIVYNMDTDTLRVQGGGVAGGGKDGAPKPKRTIEDPFKDNAQGPDDPAKSATSATKSANEASSNNAGTVQTAPTSSGRSRLIIRPKTIQKDQAVEEDADAEAGKKEKDQYKEK